MKKYIAECIGTATLVMVGCGTAMLVGCDPQLGPGYILTALAFGLSIVAMAYSIGNISGCHINPAVSLAMLISKKMSGKDFVGYIIAQCIGAFVGSGLTVIIFSLGGIVDMTEAFGANAVDTTSGSGAIWAGLIVEIVLTFIFVITILGVTSEKAKHGSFAGIVIGLTLTFVHIFGIGITGTSVNPARSIAPAVYAAAFGNTEPISCLWIFIVAPLIGGALAAVTYKALEKES